MTNEVTITLVSIVALVISFVVLLASVYVRGYYKGILDVSNRITELCSAERSSVLESLKDDHNNGMQEKE